jgi:hypothetical protein
MTVAMRAILRPDSKLIMAMDARTIEMAQVPEEGNEYVTADDADEPRDDFLRSGDDEVVAHQDQDD